MKAVKVDRGDGVVSTVIRATHLRHRADITANTDDMFGGDDMGHWNVGRINRILDACGAPVGWLSFSIDHMFGAAAAGTPDAEKARRYAGKPRETMPPLTFVEVEPGQLMMVDGHHRMLALALVATRDGQREGKAPARCLPHALCDDVRIVEIGSIAIMPDLWKEPNRVSIEAAA